MGAGVPFLSFALPSTFSIIPWSTTTVYFGSLARDIADIFDGQVPIKGTASYIFYAASGIGMVLVVAYTTIISRRVALLTKAYKAQCSDLLDEQMISQGCTTRQREAHIGLHANMAK